MNPPDHPTTPSAPWRTFDSEPRPDPPAGSPLRDYVAGDLDQHWIAWSAQHPHLAAAIDRVRLLDTAMNSLRHDAGFRAAMQRADLDEHRLHQAAEVLNLARQHLRQLLPL